MPTIPTTRICEIVTETAEQAYNRGLIDGKVSTRLDKHAQQINDLSDMMERQIKISTDLTLSVQTLTEARVTDAAARVATAKAVKESQDAQAAQANSAWSPIAKLVTIVLATCATLSVAIAIWAIFSR